MSDDVWRRGRRDGRDGRDDDDFGDFGPPLFGDDASRADMTREMDDPSDGLSFGTADTGPLPHWTAPPTGEMPSMLTSQQPAQSGGDPTDDLDVWSSFSNDAPVWSDDPAPTGELEIPTRAAVRGRRPIPSTRPATARCRCAAVRAGSRSAPTRPTTGWVARCRRRPTADPAASTRRGPASGASGTSTTGATSRTAAPPSSRDMPTAVAVGLIIAAAFIGALLFKPWAVLAIVVAIARSRLGRVLRQGHREGLPAGHRRRHRRDGVPPAGRLLGGRAGACRW